MSVKGEGVQTSQGGVREEDERREGERRPVQAQIHTSSIAYDGVCFIPCLLLGESPVFPATPRVGPQSLIRAWAPTVQTPLPTFLHSLRRTRACLLPRTAHKPPPADPSPTPFQLVVSRAVLPRHSPLPSPRARHIRHDRALFPTALRVWAHSHKHARPYMHSLS